MQQVNQPGTIEDVMPDGSDRPGSEGSASNIVAIDEGRERRDKRGKNPRLDKNDRKAQRRSARSGGTAVEEADEVSLPGDRDIQQNGTEVLVSDASADVVAADLALGDVVDVPSALAVAQPSSPALVAPLVDTTSGSKIVERTRVQFHAAESAVVNNPEVIAVIAPLIRHVNGVTEQLNDAQINLGRIMAERDALRARLAAVEGVDVTDLAIIPITETAAVSVDKHGSRLQRIESRADDARSKGSSKSKVKNPLGVDPMATREEMARVARRRQLLAIALFGAVGILLYINSREGNDISKISRDSLADLQFVGVFFNMFFMVWMLYRVVRVGGKGAKWLFPHNQQQRRH